MDYSDSEKILNELKSEQAYYLDLWKDAGVASSGDIFNKIKENERKIVQLEQMLSRKQTVSTVTRKSDISSLLQQNKIREAIDCILQDIEKSDLHNTCILLKGQFNDIENQRNLSLISFDEYKREKARIVNAILQII